MGIKICKLENECTKYVEMINYVNSVDFFKKHSDELNHYTREYYMLYGKDYDFTNDHRNNIRWMHFIHKLYPTLYSKQELPPIDDFKEAVIKQSKLCETFIHYFTEANDKIILTKEKYDSYLDNYMEFLEYHKNNKHTTMKMTPNLQFILNAHMSNHKQYVKDCQNNFGYILEHDI